MSRGSATEPAWPGYAPTSLDFINRPNPVEPLAAPPTHPLHGSGPLHQPYSRDLNRLLLDTVPRDGSGEASAKRRKADDDGTQRRDLPKLPIRPGGTTRERRNRLPPTLSGLHQPPPNSGLLPSINVDQPRRRSISPALAERGSRPVLQNTASVLQQSSVTGNSKPAIKSKSGKPTRNKWSDEETACLLQGVAKFGIGNWTKILKHDEYHFERRTALDLKDRFRVCCPEHYKKPKAASPPLHSEETTGVRSRSKPPSKRKETKDASELARLGIEEPFEKSTRRSRHGYTDADDEALMKGYKKYGKSWASIQGDKTLKLGTRRPTDLRDRFRQRYPEEYAKAGLAPRPEVFPQPPDREATGESRKTSPSPRNPDTVASKPPEDAGLLSKVDHNKPLHSRFFISNNVAPLLPPNDVFFGADDDDFDSEPIVLDRGILDWALEPRKAPANDGFNASGDNIIPLRPSTLISQSAMSSGNTSFVPLPSLATVTAAFEDDGQLELPSLMQYFTSLEGDGRVNGLGFPSLEELEGQS